MYSCTVLEVYIVHATGLARVLVSGMVPGVVCMDLIRVLLYGTRVEIVSCLVGRLRVDTDSLTLRYIKLNCRLTGIYSMSA